MKRGDRFTTFWRTRTHRVAFERHRDPEMCGGRMKDQVVEALCGYVVPLNQFSSLVDEYPSCKHCERLWAKEQNDAE